jgi:hypothetical protein
MRPTVASDPPTVIFYTAIVGLSWLRPRAADREREWRERQLDGAAGRQWPVADGQELSTVPPAAQATQRPTVAGGGGPKALA